MTLTASRDEFGAAVRRELQQRAGSHCSICRCLTDGPTSESNGVLSVGVAAHITAAAEGGPRFDPALSPEDRASAVNGIWLCQTCAREIDRDLGRYTRERLVEIKLGHEARARSRIGREPTDASTARTATLEALALHEIRRTNFELLGAPPERYEVILQRIIPFVDPIQYGPAVGMEFMDVLNGAAYRIRGTPLERNPSKREALADAAWALRGAVTHGLPIGGEMSGDEESGDEERVLCVAADVGGQLAYDGSLYTEDLRVVEAGAEILWYLLRAAVRARSEVVRRTVEDEFEKALDAAERSLWESANHAIAWLDFRRRDALAARTDDVPEMPGEAAAAIHAARRSRG